MTNDTDTTDDSLHSDIEFPCPETVGHNEKEITRPDGETEVTEMPERCQTTLTYEDNYVGLARGTEARREGYEDTALKFQCPDCGGLAYRCPVCSGDDAAPGWFVGESTGEAMACHNCNAEEVARQRRRGGRF